MIDDLRLGERREGAARVRADLVAQHGEAAQMRLVDDRVGPWNVGRTIVRPVEALVGHDRLDHAGRAVAPVEGEVGARRVHPMPEQRVGPFQLAGEAPRIGVEQQLVRIEAIAALRLVGPVGTIAVEQPDLRVRQIAVPDFIGAFRQRERRDLPLAGRVEQAEIDALRMRREHREIGAEPVPGRARADRAIPARAGPDRQPFISPRAAASRSRAAEA